MLSPLQLKFFLTSFHYFSLLVHLISSFVIRVISNEKDVEKLESLLDKNKNFSFFINQATYYEKNSDEHIIG